MSGSKKSAAHMGGTLGNAKENSALGELGSAAGGFQTVLLPAKIGKPLRCKALRG